MRLLTRLRKSAPGPDRKRRVSAASELLRGDSAGQKLDPEGALRARHAAFGHPRADGREPIKPRCSSSPPSGPTPVKARSARSSSRSRPSSMRPRACTRSCRSRGSRRPPRNHEDAASAATTESSQALALTRTAAGLHTLRLRSSCQTQENRTQRWSTPARARASTSSPHARPRFRSRAQRTAGDAKKALSVISPRPHPTPTMPRISSSGCSRWRRCCARDGQLQARELSAKLGSLAAGARTSTSRSTPAG